MSKAEDYLDGLLNSIEGKGQKPDDLDFSSGDADLLPNSGAELERKLLGPDDEFLDSFEKEFLSDDDSDDFIRQFEQELGEDKLTPRSDDALMESLDGIVDGVKERLRGDVPSEEMFDEPKLRDIIADEPDDIMVDTMGDFDGLDVGDSDLSEFNMEDDGLGRKSGLVDEDQDLMSLLQSDGDFSDIGEMLRADEENVEIPGNSGEVFEEFSLEDLTSGEDTVLEELMADIAEEEPKEEKRKAKKEKKRRKKEKNVTEDSTEEEKTGFLKNISQLLFGSDEEEMLEKAAPVKQASKSEPSAGELADESSQLLQELEGGSTEAPQEEGPSPEEEKERKKQEKKEKREQAKKAKKEKKEQAKKEKELKPKKEKKPKKPKEPDNTPPLPKKPVLLIFAMAASFLVLVMVGTNYFGYAGSVSRAEQAYGLGNYTEAYQELSGMEIEEKDLQFYEKCRIMANTSELYSAYRTFMEAGLYDMALDSLVRTSGRCHKYAEDAQTYGCVGELESLRGQAAGALGSFGISEERALELYAIEDRETYSAELYTVLERAGYVVADAGN